MHEYNINGLLVDIALVDEKVVVEADGPFHYFRDSQTLHGNTQFRNRLLQQMGWKVHGIPYFQFMPLSQEQRQSYIRNLFDRE